MMRDNRGSSRGSGGRFGGSRDRDFSSGDREMHKAVCSECGTECEVPFKPAQGKPVYCKSCYASRRPQRF